MAPATSLPATAIEPAPGDAWFAPQLALIDLFDAWARWQAGLLDHNRLPLSGDVTQWIRAWGEAVSQVGVFNVNLAGAADPALERQISSRYSYGRQLGRVLDLLAPLVEANAAALSAQVGAGPVQAFQRMVHEIDRVKGRSRSAAEIAGEVERSWRGSPQFGSQLQELVQRLQALQPAESPTEPEAQMELLELGHA